MNREIRQLVVLSQLAGRGGPVPAQELRWLLGEAYPDRPDSAHHRFSADMAALRDAGLIRYDSLRGESPVALVRWVKEPHLHLSRAEHEALQDAHRIVGEAPGPVGPVPAGGGSAKLSVIVALLRRLEEAAIADVTELAEATGMRPTRIRQLLRRLEELREYDVLKDFELEREAESPRGGEPLETAALLRTGKGDHPTKGIGLDEFGLFAYSSDEVADRLELIERGLAAPEHRDKPSLRSARAKLSEWQQKLKELASISAEFPLPRP